MTVTVPKYAKIKHNLLSRKQQTKRDILYRLGGVENFVRFYSTLFYSTLSFLRYSSEWCGVDRVCGVC
jgi:hypothetical protein